MPDVASHEVGVDPWVRERLAEERRSSPRRWSRAGSRSAAASTCPSPRRRSGTRPRGGAVERDRRAGPRCPESLHDRSRARGPRRLTRPPVAARGRAPIRWSVKRVIGHGQARKKSDGDDEPAAVEVACLVDLGGAGRSRRRPRVETSAVSFCSEMKSFSSGGMTVRTAWGKITRRIVATWVSRASGRRGFGRGAPR